MEGVYSSFIQSYAELDSFLREHWPIGEEEFPPNLNQTLRFFIQTMISRARGSFMLLQIGSYWESEIVLRSLLEAAVRCATFSRRKDVDRLLEEYWVELQASTDRKVALRAAMAQELIPEGSTDRPIFEALQNNDWFVVEPQANKRRRRRLDQEWSLPELIGKLQSADDTIEPIIGFDAMLHSYGLQSEVLHVSARYYDLLLDRMTRKEDLRYLENTHYCRQMADAIQLTAFCVYLSLERLGETDLDTLKQPIIIANEFSKLVKPYQDEFDRSQGFV